MMSRRGLVGLPLVAGRRRWWRYPVNPVIVERALRDLITTWQMRDDAAPCAAELEETLNRFVPPPTV